MNLWEIGSCLRVYLDVETTGINPDVYHVVELGAVAFERGKEIASFSSLVNPGEEAVRKADSRAFAVNKLDPDEILKAHPVGAVASEFRNFLEKHRGLLHAYSIDFEMSFLTKPPWSVSGPWGECVMVASRSVMAESKALRLINGIPKRPNLGEAAEFFGVKIDGPAHRALPDARKTGLIHTQILEWRAVDDEVIEMIEDGM